MRMDEKGLKWPHLLPMTNVSVAPMHIPVGGKASEKFLSPVEVMYGFMILVAPSKEVKSISDLNGLYVGGEFDAPSIFKSELMNRKTMSAGYLSHVNGKVGLILGGHSYSGGSSWAGLQAEGICIKQYDLQTGEGIGNGMCGDAVKDVMSLKDRVWIKILDWMESLFK